MMTYREEFEREEGKSAINYPSAYSRWLENKLNSLILSDEEIDIKDFVPIHIGNTRREWKVNFNIPTEKWDRIEVDLKTINDESIPNTLRHFLLNNLPYSVVRILQRTH